MTNNIILVVPIGNAQDYSIYCSFKMAIKSLNDNTGMSISDIEDSYLFFLFEDGEVCEIEILKVETHVVNVDYKRVFK